MSPAFVPFLWVLKVGFLGYFSEYANQDSSGGHCSERRTIILHFFQLGNVLTLSFQAVFVRQDSHLCFPLCESPRVYLLSLNSDGIQAFLGCSHGAILYTVECLAVPGTCSWDATGHPTPQIMATSNSRQCQISH